LLKKLASGQIILDASPVDSSGGECVTRPGNWSLSSQPGRHQKKTGASISAHPCQDGWRCAGTTELAQPTVRLEYAERWTKKKIDLLELVPEADRKAREEAAAAKKRIESEGREMVGKLLTSMKRGY